MKMLPQRECDLLRAPCAPSRPRLLVATTMYLQQRLTSGRQQAPRRGTCMWHRHIGASTGATGCMHAAQALGSIYGIGAHAWGARMGRMHGAWASPCNPCFRPNDATCKVSCVSIHRGRAACGLCWLLANLGNREGQKRERISAKTATVKPESSKYKIPRFSNR